MMPAEAAAVVTCPHCWQPAGKPCIVAGHANPKMSHVHGARWDFGMRMNHDTGDEDRL